MRRGDEETTLGVKGAKQICPQVSVVLEVLLHDDLPLAKRALTHRKETLRVEYLLNLHPVMMLHSLLCICDRFEELSQQLLVDRLVRPIFSLDLSRFDRGLNNVHHRLDDNFLCSLSLLVNISCLSRPTVHILSQLSQSLPQSDDNADFVGCDTVNLITIYAMEVP